MTYQAIPLTQSIKALTYTHHHLGRPGPSSPPWPSPSSARLPEPPSAPCQVELGLSAAPSACTTAAGSRWDSAEGGSPLPEPAGAWASGRRRLPGESSRRSRWSAGYQAAGERWGLEGLPLEAGGWWGRTGWWKGAGPRRWDLETGPGSRCGLGQTGAGRVLSLQPADKGRGCRSDSCPRGSTWWPGSAAGNARLGLEGWSWGAGRRPCRRPGRCLDGGRRVGYGSRNEGTSPRSGAWRNPCGLLHTRL